MSSESAFNYIPEVIYILLQLDEDFLIWETLYFLIDLYRIAETTEIPEPDVLKEMYKKKQRVN